MRRGRTAWGSLSGELRPLPKFSLLRWKPAGPWPPSVADWTPLSTVLAAGECLHTLVPPVGHMSQVSSHNLERSYPFQKDLPLCLVWGIPDYRMLPRNLGRNMNTLGREGKAGCWDVKASCLATDATHLHRGAGSAFWSFVISQVILFFNTCIWGWTKQLRLSIFTI